MGDVLYSVPLAAGTYTMNLWEEDDGPNPYQVSVNTVPLPAAAWFFGSALLGGLGVARAKRRQA